VNNITQGSVKPEYFVKEKYPAERALLFQGRVQSL
jgi:hypothetical protein